MGDALQGRGPRKKNGHNLAKKDKLRDRLHEFQLTHFNKRDKITNLWYESKRSWANLAKLYLEEAALPIMTKDLHDMRLVRH
jgi:hypothetical protein